MSCLPPGCSRRSTRTLPPHSARKTWARTRPSFSSPATMPTRRRPSFRPYKAGGLDAIDAGGLSRARELEAMGFLQIKLAAGEEVDSTGGFGVVR